MLKSMRPPMPGDRAISADVLQSMLRELHRQGKLDADGAVVDSSGSGIQIVVPPKKPAFWARLLAPYGGGAYSWVEVERSSIGVFTDLQYGRYDDGLNPAVHSNLQAGFPTDASAGSGRGMVVWLELGFGLPFTGGVFQEWIFRDGGAGGAGTRPIYVIEPSLGGPYYRARIEYRDETQAPPVWYAQSPPEEVLAIGYNDEPLFPNRRYKGLLVAFHPLTSMPVYAVVADDVPSTVELVRIDEATPSGPCGSYRATVMRLDAPSCTWVEFEQCWFLQTPGG